MYCKNAKIAVIILTFHFQVCFAWEIIALPDDTGVPSGITDLRMLDDQGEHVIIIDERELGTLVTFLYIGKEEKIAENGYLWSCKFEDFFTLIGTKVINIDCASTPFILKYWFCLSGIFTKAITCQ